jgi:putative methanogenesis marker protein 17
VGRRVAIRIVVDCTDSKGGELYELIARRSLEDLALGGSVESVHIFIRTEVPLFIIKIKYREFVGRNTLGELSRIVERPNGVRVTLESEVDLGDALKALWSIFGRDKVEQLGRMDINVVGAKDEEVREVKIRDKALDISVKINELAARIIPEGFRARSVSKGAGVMTFIAAEDPIKDEWKEIASRMEVGD